MVRTVRVRLELDRNDYKAGLRDAANDTRTFDAEIKTLGKSADRTGVELKNVGDGATKLGDDVKRSSREVDGLGNSSTKTTTKVKTLDTQIREARANVRQLGEEFLRTKDVDVFEKMRAAGGDLAGLQRTKKDLDNLVGEFDKVGRKGGQAMEEGLGQAFRDFQAESGVILPAAIAVAVTEGAPVIGAAVSAAVLLGLGAVGLGAGIALSFSDPKVSAAATGFGREVKTRLQEAAADSFREPLVNAFALFDAGFNKLEPRIRRIFAGLAPEIERLAQGLVGLIDRAGPGLEHAFAAAGPVLDALAAQLPKLGDALSAMFDSFARSGPGATRFLNFFMTWIDGALRGIGLFTEALSKTFEILTSGAGLAVALGPLGAVLQGLGVSGDSTQKSMQRLKDTTDAQGESAHIAGASIADYANNVRAAADALGTLNQRVDDFLGKALSEAQATLAVNQGWLQVTQALKDNGHTLDEHSAKGLANRQVLLGQIGDLQRARDAAIAHAGGEHASAAAVDAANAAYDQGVGHLAALMRQAGFTDDQIRDLSGDMRSIPNIERDIIINTVHRDVYQSYKISPGGASPYQQSASTILGASAEGAVVSYAGGGVDFRSRAGIYSAKSPGVYMMAEPRTGGEVLIPNRGISDARGLALANVAANAHGGQVVAMGGGATTTVVHEHRVVIGYPDGRKIGELLISDAEHGGTAVTTFIRRVANR